MKHGQKNVKDKIEEGQVHLINGASLLDEGSQVLGTMSKPNKVGQIIKQVGRPKKNILGVKKTTRTKVVKSITIHNARGTSMVVSTQQKTIQFFSFLVVVWA
jgi:hypothetical protein